MDEYIYRSRHSSPKYCHSRYLSVNGKLSAFFKIIGDFNYEAYVKSKYCIAPFKFNFNIQLKPQNMCRRFLTVIRDTDTDVNQRVQIPTFNGSHPLKQHA